MIDHRYFEGIVETRYHGPIGREDSYRHVRHCVTAYGPDVLEIAQYDDDVVSTVTLTEALQMVERNYALFAAEGAHWTTVYVRSGNPYVEAWIAFIFNQPSHRTVTRWVADSYEHAKQLYNDLIESSAAQSHTQISSAVTRSIL